MVEAGEFGGPPNGYHPLPEGHRCRCPKLWTDGKGNHWCCRPIPTASPAPALPERGVEALREAATEALDFIRGNFSLGVTGGRTNAGKLVDQLRAALATPAASPARSEDEAEAFIQAAVDRAPEPLRRLGEWLANVLDDDEWKTAERMLLGATVAASPSPAPAAVEDIERIANVLTRMATNFTYRHEWSRFDAEICREAAAALSTLAADKARLVAERDSAQALMGKALNVLGRCHTVLFNMAKENKGAILNRWPISHEPLRSDARNLLPLIDEVLGHD